VRDLRFQRSECRELLKKTGHVAVVGGGLAGLMAARELVKHGIKVTVYEARKEVGGRVLSTFSKGRITEEGAELIGSFHTNWLELAREFGLAMISRMDPELYEREGLNVQLILHKRLSRAEFKDFTTQMDDRVLTPLAGLATLIDDPSRPWKQKSLKWVNKDWPMTTLDNMSVQEALPKFCQISERQKNPADEPLWQMLEFKLVNDEVAPLDEMNFLGLLCKVRGGQGERFSPDPPPLEGLLLGYWDELEIFRCADGCQALATKIAEKIKTKKYGPEPATVRRLVAVTHINLSSAGVTLGIKATRADGKFVDDKPSFIIPGFSYVILAIPPSVWPRVKITANGQDADPAKEIGQMHMNDAVKYFSDMKERFWIEKNAAPYGGALRLGQIWEGTDNQTRVGEQGIVLSVFAGPVSASRRVPTEDDFRRELSNLYRDYADNLTNKPPPYLVNWPKKPFIMTGYWTPYPGEIFRVGEKLSKPYHDRLLFAGEHTQMDSFGYMEGALRSGERAAETLMLKQCGLPEEEPAPKSPSPPPQRPAPKSPGPPILARATPTREATAFEREFGAPLDERSATDYPGEAESPFLHQELFVKKSEEEWEPRAAALVAESPFAGALDECRSRFDEDRSEEEEALDELKGEEESEAAEAWEELEEEELTPQADQVEDESLDYESAPLREDETKLESPEGFAVGESQLEGSPEDRSDDLSLDKEQEWRHSELEFVLASPDTETEWSPELSTEEAEDFTGADYKEDELELLHEQPLEERFDPSTIPKDVADALGKKDWLLALKLAIQAGWRDENDLTNLIFFTRHPELPNKPLDRKRPMYDQLSVEWTQIRETEVRIAIRASAVTAVKTTIMPKPTTGQDSIDVHVINLPLFHPSRRRPAPFEVRQASGLANCPVASTLAALAFTAAGQALLQKMLTMTAAPTVTDISGVKSLLSNPPSGTTLDSFRFFTVRLPGGSVDVSDVLYTDDVDHGWSPKHMHDPGDHSIWAAIIEKALAMQLGSYENFDALNLKANDFWEKIVGKKPDGFEIKDDTPLTRIIKVAKASTRVASIGASKPNDADVKVVTAFHGFAMLGFDGKRIKLYDPAKAKTLDISPSDFRHDFQAILFQK
jgi:monoamine oxidase